MINYAKISEMIEFQRIGLWPLNEFLNKGGGKFQGTYKDILRILLKKGPVKSPYQKNVTGIPVEVFRMGTRGWEYPWVQTQIYNKVKPGSKVLDCGCGINGFPLILYNNGYEVSGLDYFTGKKSKQCGYGLPDSYMKKYSGKMNFINGGMEDIPICNDIFDIVTCISVMEHVVIENKENPGFHKKCLSEMVRVLKPGGFLICTYDTILNSDVVFANKYGWDKDGWYYKNDIEFLYGLGMISEEKDEIPTRENIIIDEDTFFIPPDFYFVLGYGKGFENYGIFHKLTSVGFILKKY